MTPMFDKNDIMKQLQYSPLQMVALEQLIESFTETKMSKRLEHHVHNLNRECFKRFKEAETRIYQSLSKKIARLQDMFEGAKG